MRGLKGLWMGLFVAVFLILSSLKAAANVEALNGGVLDGGSSAIGAKEERFITYVDHTVLKDDIGFVYLHNGRVLRIEKAADAAAFLRFTKYQAISIRVIDHGTFDELLEVRDAEQPAGFGKSLNGEPLDDVSFEAEDASNLNTQAIDPTPTGVFNYMKAMGFRGGECFHRAYLWAYDTWTKEKISTHKTFLFFTRKYIEQYRYKWWFHVAPMLIDDGVEWMLDPRFTSAPRSVKRWTDIFMKNAAVCPVISKYEGYERHHKDKWCYLRKTTMYYYHPNSVLRSDSAGRTETKFDEDGLYFARKALGRLFEAQSNESQLK